MTTTTKKLPGRSRPRQPLHSSRCKLESRRAMLEHVATRLATTMALEESVFYPGVIQPRTIDPRPQLVSRDRRDRRLPGVDVSAPEFQAKVASLKSVILHHVQERVDDFLPNADEVPDERRLAESCRRMKSLFFRVAEAGYRQAFRPGQTTTALPWAHL